MDYLIMRLLYDTKYVYELKDFVLTGNKGAWRGDDWTWEWCWRNTPRGRVMRDITELCNLVQSVQLNKNVKDKCSWELSEDGKFSVKDLRGLIDEKTLGSTRRRSATPWCKSIPKKDVLNLHGINSFSGINRERWKAVIWSMLYIIWSNRNRIIFRRNGSMIPDLFKEVQLRSFGWISARSKKDDVKREEWFNVLNNRH
ncbi:hypothetical protein Tco_1226150 [Tanacetum coccineum]